MKQKFNAKAKYKQIHTGTFTNHCMYQYFDIFIVANDTPNPTTQRGVVHKMCKVEGERSEQWNQVERNKGANRSGA